jgi:carboxymethylenebutenolidase
VTAAQWVAQWVEIPVEGGAMPAFVAGDGAPALVMLQEIFGVNAAMQEKARRFARLGFTVLVPDLFWRLQPRVALGYTEPERKKGFELFNRFDFAAGVKDIAAAARWLEPRHSAVGVVGFCLGGKLAVTSSAAYPFAAVASVYGVKLEADKARLRAIDVPLQIHVGDSDAHVPVPAIAEIRQALEGRPEAEVFVYAGAGHGFFNAARSDVFAPEAAALAEQRIAGLFRRALGAGRREAA